VLSLLSSCPAKRARVGAGGIERIRAALPDARVAVLRGRGHVAIMTAPELVADEVACFLSE
jgi:hypothetical protein